MMDSALTNRCLVPSWLRLRFRERIPDAWSDLLYEFVGLLDEMYREQPRTAAVLQTGQDGVQLLLRFRCRPAPTPREDEVLRGIALRLSQLSAYSPVPKQPPQGESAPHAGWSHQTTHSTEFDLDDYIADRVESALRPREVTVFEWDSEQQVEQRAGARDSDQARRVVQTLKRLASTGERRPLAKPAATWEEQFDALERESPNFVPVLRAIIKPHLAMCALGITHRMPPVLLVGPPGVGKTRFANALASLLALPPPLFVSFAEETNGSALAGSSTFWANSSPGRLFELLAWGSQGRPAVANPLLVIDEIDKRSALHFDPLGALYGLLEPDTARCFVDQSIPDVTMNASHVRIVATANDASALPEPLLSRLTVFSIEPPTPQQMANIVASIHLSLITQMNIAVSSLLPDELVRQAMMLSPRLIKTRLETCIGHALLAGRTDVQIEDWHAANLGLGVPRRARIGFASS